MTAEETALEEFREAVRRRRILRRDAKHLSHMPPGRSYWAMHLETRTQVRTLARIIRAIRRENRGDQMRASYEASVSEQVIHAETAWYDRGYAQGRRDALREAIDLCRHTEAGDTNHDWREAAKCCRELIESLAAKAAEEAAIRARRRVREVLEANGTNPERFVEAWCRAQAEYETEESAR